MSRPKNGFVRTPQDAAVELLVDPGRILQQLPLGTWVPNIDLCETPDKVIVRVELPGVDPGDVNVSVQGDALRVSGIKREPAVSQKLVCYYCVERRYGRFDREMRIRCVIDAQKARSVLRNGVLTIEFPRLRERRGSVLRIPVLREGD